MQIIHIGVWTHNLEGMRYFYINFFKGRSNALYSNPQTGFESYLITFPDNSVAINLMRRDEVKRRPARPYIGIAGLVFKAKNVFAVQTLTDKLRKENVPVIRPPRITGEGFFGSIVSDPDGNEVEIVTDVMPAKSGREANGHRRILKKKRY